MLAYLAKSISAAAAIGLIGAGLASAAFAADFTMKFGTATINEDQHEFIKTYKEEIEAASNGRISVEIYPQSQLGNIQRHIEGLQLGTIEGFIGPADFFVGVDPRFGAFSTPTLFRDRLHAAATVADPELNEAVRMLAAKKGLVGLGVYCMAQHDYLGVKPFRTLADFEGKKIRVNATQLERTALDKLGASASPMSLGEVLPSLERGVIDGTRSALSIFVSLKYNDISPTVTVTNDTMIIPVAMVSKVWLDNLPEDLRKAVLDAGLRTQKRNQEWANEFHKGMPERWQALGGELIQLPAADQATLIERLKPVGDEIAAGDPVFAEMLGKVRAVAAKY